MIIKASDANIKRKFWLVFFVAVIFFAVSWLIFPHNYYINDDRMIMQFLSGRFTGEPEAYGIYPEFLLTGFLSLLYRMADTVDWYILFLLLSNAFSFFVYFYYALSKTKRWQEVALTAVLSVVLFVLYYICGFTIPTYTISAVMLCFAAVTEVYSGGFSARENALLVILVFLSFNLRRQGFLMGAPLLIWVAVYRFVKGDIFLRRKILIAFGSVAAVLLLSTLVTHIAYGSEEWQAYTAYNAARTVVYDYGINTMSFEQSKEIVLGNTDISRTDFSCLQQYSLLLSQGLEEKMPYIADAFNNLESSFGEKVANIKESILGFIPQFFFAALLSIWCMVFSVFEKDLKQLFWKITSIGGSFLVVMYLFWKGRILERVINPAFSLVALVALLWSIADIGRLKEKDKKFKIISTVAICIIAVAGIALSGKVCTDVYKNAVKSADDNYNYAQLEQYCAENDDKIYFLTSRSLPAGYSYSVFTENNKLNYIELGNWDTFSPLSEKMLESYGIADVKQYLEAEEKVRIVTADSMRNTSTDIETIAYVLPEGWSYTLEEKLGVYNIYSINKE